jgi:hypothetical protein
MELVVRCVGILSRHSLLPVHMVMLFYIEYLYYLCSDLVEHWITWIVVTAVGATKFSTGMIGPEAAADTFHSGGGFSWYFGMPR